MKIVRFVSILNHTIYAPLEALIETLTRLPSQKNLRRLLSRTTPSPTTKVSSLSNEINGEMGLSHLFLCWLLLSDLWSSFLLWSFRTKYHRRLRDMVLDLLVLVLTLLYFFIVSSLRLRGSIILICYVHNILISPLSGGSCLTLVIFQLHQPVRIV